MDIKKVINQLSQKYPDKLVVITDTENPTEIICEIDPTRDHPEWSRAIAVVESIRPHYHKKTTENYKVIKGVLSLYVGDEVIELNPGESAEIMPNLVHWAKGDEVWFEVFSEPGWSPEDHILLKEDVDISRKDIEKYS